MNLFIYSLITMALFVLLPLLLASAFGVKRIVLFWWLFTIAWGLFGQFWTIIGFSPRIYLLILLATTSCLCLWVTAKYRRNIRFGVYFFFLVLMFIALIPEVIYNPVQLWDGVAIWFSKAKHIVNQQPMATSSMPFYPFLGSYFWSTPLNFIGLKYEPIGRLVFQVFFYMTAVLLADRVESSKRILLLLGFIYMFPNADMFLSGYQDGFLFLLATISIVLFLDAKDSSNNWIPYFFAAALASVKNEGLIFGSILIFSIGLLQQKAFQSNKERIRNVFVFVFFAAFPVFLRWISGVDVREVQGSSYSMKSLQSIDFQRIPYLLTFMARWYADHLKEGLVFAVILAFFWRLSSRSTFLRILLALLLQHAFLVVAFLLTQQDFQWHVGTALPRMLFQSSAIWAALGIHISILALNSKETLRDFFQLGH